MKNSVAIGISEDNISWLRGVTWVAPMSKWKAHLGVDGKPMFLDYFATEIEAALAHDVAAREFFGDSAICNFDLPSISTEIRKSFGCHGPGFMLG